MKTANYWGTSLLHLNWEQISAHLLEIAWQLLITTLLFYLIAHFGKKIISQSLASKKRAKNKRTRTITALANSAFQYTVIFFYLFGILSILGIPVGTLLASAGIFSLAIGLGAQGFVSDLVNGFFILSEDQFDVGDTVSINQEVGTVLQLGLRTTRLRTSSGAIIFIPNRNIALVKNLAHNAIGLTLNLQLAANNDFTQVKKLISQTNQNLQASNYYLAAEPNIIGLTKQEGPIVVFSVFFKVKANRQSQIKDLYLSAYLKTLQAHHIKLATIKQTGTK